MEIDGFSISPRKKHKAHHVSKLNIEEHLRATSSTAMQDQGAINASGNDDRLDKEAQCGIIEYVSPNLPGFRGVLKKRYTDFLVNEILPNGKVIHLENLKKPSDQQRLSQVASKATQHRNENSGQAPPIFERPLTSKENVPPQFESTNLNKVEHGSRKKETVYMQHGAESLSLVKEPHNDEVEDLKANSKFEDEEGSTHDKGTQLAEADNNDAENIAPITKEELGGGTNDQPEASTNGAADNTETSSPPKSSDQITAEGWQAYAHSKTGGSTFAVSSIQL